MKKVKMYTMAEIENAKGEGFAVISLNERYEVKCNFGELHVYDTEYMCSVGVLDEVWAKKGWFYISF